MTKLSLEASGVLINCG